MHTYLSEATVFALGHGICNSQANCLQYVELAYTLYEGYSVYAAALLATTLISGVISTRVSYLKRLQLYTSVAQQRVVPLVQRGRVR